MILPLFSELSTQIVRLCSFQDRGSRSFSVSVISERFQVLDSRAQNGVISDLSMVALSTDPATSLTLVVNVLNWPFMSRIRVGKKSLDADSLETWNNKITLQYDLHHFENWEMEVPEYKNTFLLQSRNTKFLFSKIRANGTNTKEFSFYALRLAFQNCNSVR